MNKNSSTVIVIVLVIISVIYLTSHNSSSTGNTGMHVMNGHIMDNNNMQGAKTLDNQPAAQSHRSYNLKLTSSIDNLQAITPIPITYKIIDDQGNILKDFAIDHTKLMHFIVIRKDLQDFQHIHPDFNKDTGEFSIPVTFPDNGTYRLFADFAPVGSQMDTMGMPLGVTTSQDVNVGDLTKYTPSSVAPDTQTIKTVGDYKLDYTIQPIQSGKDATIIIHITKNGYPVTDLEQYLGAKAHGILLKKDTLDFAHLHDMGQHTMTHMMNGKMMTMQMGSDTGPEITFIYNFPSSGVYKLFTQFQHQGNVITSDYTVKVD